MPEELTGAQIMARALLDCGVDTIFGYPGGAIMPFYNALPDTPALRHVLVRHEQAAAHAADGYARASGRVGVCIATSGPGATNLVTGLATAHADSTPVVAITGQVGRAALGTDAFQETDVLGLALPITKHCRLVRDVSELADAVREALQVAQDGRPGAVWLDVPKDVQNQRGPYIPVRLSPAVRASVIASEALPHAAALIAAAQRPIILAGHGVILGQAYDELRHFAEHTGIPVITTLLGISAIPEDHPLYLGMPGMHGEVHVNRAIQQADLLIAVGMRFDDRVTGSNAGFAPRAKVLHLELDPAEIDKVRKADCRLIGDVKVTLPALTAQCARRADNAWMREIKGWQRHARGSFRFGMAPEAILAAMAAACGDRATIVSDVGQHQMWVAKLYPYLRRNSHITSGGLGTMGFAVPAAMGVKLARPDDVVWAISGDGGFQMNLQEMATMQQEKIGVKLAVFNNGYLGMVRQWQQLFHDRRYSQTPIWSPDYVKLAEAYGIPGFRVQTAGDITRAVRGALDTDGPALIEFCIEQEANVLPMIPPGATLSEPIVALATT